MYKLRKHTKKSSLSSYFVMHYLLTHFQITFKPSGLQRLKI